MKIKEIWCLYDYDADEASEVCVNKQLITLLDAKRTFAEQIQVYIHPRPISYYHYVIFYE